MISLKETTDKYTRSNLEDNLKRDYISALKDKKFQGLVNRFEITDEVGMKYTSKLEKCVECLKKCDKCKSLIECKNEVEGCIYYPKKNGDKLEFNYVTCKYKNKQIEEDSIKKSKFFGISSDIKNAKMSDIDITDKKRYEIIKWLKNFFDNYPNERKGLFLHGSFGSGKTYLISALFNELAKKDYTCLVIYYPEMLSKLKSSFDGDESYADLLNEIKCSDLLLLDDLGAETVTNWSRDEILGTILQYRMENNLSTFITSNLNLDELDMHLSLVKNTTDKVKSRRIIERIKQLTNDMELVSKNRRN